MSILLTQNIQPWWISTDHQMLHIPQFCLAVPVQPLHGRGSRNQRSQCDQQVRLSRPSVIRELTRYKLQSRIMIDTKLFHRTKYQKLNNEVTLNNNVEKKSNINEKTGAGDIKIIKNFSSSKIIDTKTLSSQWFRPSITRKQAEAILKFSSVGTFLVRNSSSKNTSYVLSVRIPGQLVQHHLLIVSNSQIQMVGSKKTFSSIFSLVTHLSIMKESLACRLVIPTLESDGSSDENEDIIDIDEEPEMEKVILQLKKFLSVE